jgi:SAM-dependent methyltransferase
MTQTLKAKVKAFAPAPLLDAWRWIRFEVERLRDRRRPLDELFFDVYKKGKWGESGLSPFFSGIGSLPRATGEYEAFVAAYLEKTPKAHTLVDIGCGDFQVAARTLERLSRPVHYIGCDIARNVLAYNTERFARPGIEFRALDITRDEPPAGDIVTVREVLQHLSNDAILAALKNLRRQFKAAIITEAVFVKPSAPNLDMVSGRSTRDRQRSGVYIDLPPFTLPVLDECHTICGPGEIYRTTLVSLE